jgi:hypothetical protein
METMGWGPYQADHEDASGQFEVRTFPSFSPARHPSLPTSFRVSHTRLFSPAQSNPLPPRLLPSSTPFFPNASHSSPSSHPAHLLLHLRPPPSFSIASPPSIFTPLQIERTTTTLSSLPPFCTRHPPRLSTPQPLPPRSIGTTTTRCSPPTASSSSSTWPAPSPKLTASAPPSCPSPSRA